jgi:hypothetical protein
MDESWLEESDIKSKEWSEERWTTQVLGASTTEERGGCDRSKTKCRCCKQNTVEMEEGKNL